MSEIRLHRHDQAAIAVIQAFPVPDEGQKNGLDPPQTQSEHTYPQPPLSNPKFVQKKHDQANHNQEPPGSDGPKEKPR